VGAVGPHRASGSLPAFTGRATAAFVVTSPDALVTKEVAAILLLADYTPAICAGARAQWSSLPARATLT